MSDDDERKDWRGWVPFFIGTSLAITLPFFVIRRAKTASLKLSLNNPSSAPPRRAIPRTTPSSTHKYTHTINTSQLSTTDKSSTSSSSPSDFDHPSTSQLLSAVSKADLNTAFLAGKAFLIATSLVGIGTFGLIYSIQTIFDIDNVPEFARRMRYWTNTNLSTITLRIHRAPETTEERQVAYELAPIGVDEDWTWEEAEKRLKLAYDQGGFSLWAQVALRELEAEARVERAKRLRELEVVSRQDS